MAIYNIDSAPLLILAHAAVGVSAVVLGGLVVFRRKGTFTHRVLGRLWAALMYFMAIGSFWIQSDGHFSWIHGLSAMMIVSLTYAIWAVKTGRTRGHRIAMTSNYVGLCVTAAFTLLPHRLMGQLVF
jgi:uncharacterized membrane protein